MYKILILYSSPEVSPQELWTPALNADGKVFETDVLETLQDKCRELLDQSPVPKILPIDDLNMNVEVTVDVTIPVVPDPEPEPEPEPTDPPVGG